MSHAYVGDAGHVGSEFPSFRYCILAQPHFLQAILALYTTIMTHGYRCLTMQSHGSPWHPAPRRAYACC